MLGKTLALMVRSIREDTRLLHAHLFRLFLLLFIFWFLIMTQAKSIGIGAPGLKFFEMVTYLNLCFITLGGVGYFATAITEEKEEMTLGLLKMADIGPLTLLLGKSMPRLIAAVLLLSAQFPFTLLAITLGGVTMHQVTAAYCSLTSYTLMLAGLGLLCSVVFPRSRTATFVMSWIVGLFLLVPWWLSSVMAAGFYSGTIGTAAETLFGWLYQASAIGRLDVIMTTGFAAPAVGFQVITNTAAGCVFFLLAWATFNVFNRDDQPASPGRGLLWKSPARLQRITRRRAWRNALFWKDLHFMAGGLTTLLVKFVLYGLLAAVLAFILPSWRGRFTWEYFGEALMLCALWVFLIEGGVHAARIFQQEVKWKTLSSIMMLPISTARVAYAKIAGCLIAFVPVVCWFVIGALLAPGSFGDFLEEVLDEPGFWLMVFNYVLLLHLITFLSLFVKWGAIPLGIGIVFFTNMVCISTMQYIFFTMGNMGSSSVNAMFAVMCFLELLATLVLHFCIGVRLRTIAAR